MMRQHIDVLRLRAVLGRDQWSPPMSTAQDTWALVHRDGDGSVLVSVRPGADGALWCHASMTRRGRVPTYADLKTLHRAAFGTGWAYQVFAPPAEHVNHHEFALHLWGRVDGREALPDFTENGTI